MVQRHLPDVIDRVLERVPDDRERLRARLLRIKISSNFRSPELVWSVGGEEAADAFGDEFPPLLDDYEPWQREVAEIWSVMTWEQIAAGACVRTPPVIYESTLGQ